MAQKNTIALADFFKDSNIKVLTNPNEVPKDSITFIGSSSCPFSILSAPQFRIACEQSKDKTCNIIDVATEEGINIVNKLGIEFEAVPTVRISKDGKQTSIVGMKLANEYLETFNASNQNKENKIVVGNKNRIFPL